MACPKATHGRHRLRINFLLAHPATRAARNSKVLAQHLDNHGYLTPHFAVDEMADTITGALPPSVRPAAIHHCWNLERFSRALVLNAHRRVGHRHVMVVINGPYRTRGHNATIHGAVDSQHVHGDATDHFKAEVEAWSRETGLSEAEIIRIAKRYFTAIGNENSGTLHFDSRPGKPGSIIFTTWQGVR